MNEDYPQWKTNSQYVTYEFKGDFRGGLRSAQLVSYFIDQPPRMLREKKHFTGNIKKG